MKNKLTRIFISIKNTMIQFGWLLVIIIPIFLFINYAVLSIVDAQKETINTRLVTTAEQEMVDIDMFMDIRLNVAHDDIHIMLDADETIDYLQDPSPEHMADYENLIYRISVNKKSFARVMIVEPDGDIVYRLTRDNTNQIQTESGDLGTITTVYFYSLISQVEYDKLFMSQLYMNDDKPTLTFVKPMAFDDDLISYLVIDYDANDLLSMLGLHTSESETYFDYGVINNGVIWQMEEATQTLHIVTNPEDQATLFDRIVKNNNVITYLYALSEQDEHYAVEAQNGLRFYILMDINKAIENSESVFLRNAATIAITTNLLAGALITFLAYMFRVRKDDRLLIDANMYLSVQNEDSVMVVNKRLRVIYGNPAFERLFGYSLKEAYLQRILDLIRVNFIDTKINLKQMVDYGGHTWSKTKSGIYLLNYLRVKEETFLVGRDKHYIGIHSDSKIHIDNYKHYVLSKNETVDELSRLFSINQINLATSTMFLLSFNDIDTIKFANFLKTHLNRHDFITVPQKHHVMIYAELTKNELQQEITHIDRLIGTYKYKYPSSDEITHHFTIARASETVYTIPLLIEATLATLAYAKEKPRVRYQIFKDDMKYQIELQKQIENELDNGFKNQEFYLTYQVIKNIHTGKIAGVESLLRWENNRLGQIYPNQFIPVIEKSFFINRLTLMVVEIAIYDFENLKDFIDDQFKISINLSAFDLNNDFIIDQIIHEINQSNLKPSNFFFEISEDQYMYNLEKTKEAIAKFHDNDILIAVDNFGTGYSSVNLLKSINVDSIKIDKSYIMNYPGEDNGQMLDTFIHLIHRFNKPIVIEGVETKAHLDYCITKKIEYIQGYYISKPVRSEVLKSKFLI